jgi:hypothetical protein
VISKIFFGVIPRTPLKRAEPPGEETERRGRGRREGKVKGEERGEGKGGEGSAHPEMSDLPPSQKILKKSLDVIVL